jgi:hypothetical protein
MAKRAGVRLPIAALVALALAGCGERGRKAEEFIPPEDPARLALEASLSAWRAGTPGVQVPDTSPVVNFADTQKEAGRRLLDFAVLGPAPGDSPRCFAVRLTLAGPEEELRTRYVVIGIDPLWVIRHDDFEMITHWDHRMPPDKKGGKK